MQDRLNQVLKAVESRSKIVPDKAASQFTLISYSTLKTDSYDSIRNFQAWIKEHYGVSLLVCGGGYGCTSLDFEIVSSSTEEAINFVKQMIGDPTFHAKAREAHFRILIIKDPWTRIDLVRGTVEGGEGLEDYLKGGITMNIDQSTKINAPVIGSAVSTASSNLSQAVTINSDLGTLFSHILQKAEEDGSISKKQYRDVVDQLAELRSELSSQKPKKAVVERILTNLGSMASIGALVDKIAPFLPTLF